MKIPASLSQNVAFILHNTAREYQKYFDQEMSGLKLTRSQWLLLSQLYFFEGINQTELSDILDVGKAALGRLVTKLEKKGWISRVLDDGDARAYKLYLSKEATPLVKRLVSMLMEETERSLKDFTTAEIALLRDFMVRIKTNINEVPPSSHWNESKEGILLGLNDLECNDG